MSLDDGLRRLVWGADLSYSKALVGLGDLEVHHSDGLGSVRALTQAAALTQTYRRTRARAPEGEA